MALENWIDKQDGIDEILAEDINAIANAVIETQSDKQDNLVSGTNIKTINNQSILGSGNITIEGGSDVEVDQIYSPTSENAQSGKAVAEAIALTVEIKPSKIDLPFEYNGGNSGEYFAKLISIDKISNTRSYLRFEFGGSTLNAYVNCPKDELVTYGLEIGKFYFIKISGEQISDKTMEIQKFSKISIDQNYNPISENAQSGKAVAEAVLPKLDKPENAPQIGDTLRVTSVNTDGTFACKWAEVGNGSESVGKCIGEITLEENARIVEFTQCQDGSPLNFSEVIITISGSSDSIRNICFDVNHTYNAEAYGWTMTTGAQLNTDSRYVTVHAKIIGGWMLLGTTQNANIYNTSVNNGHHYISVASNNNEKITESIVIGIGWGYMAAGTIIKVWGR